MDDQVGKIVDDMDVLLIADKQAEIFQRFIGLAEKVRPRLRQDGANFNMWSKNMTLAWTTYFMGDPDYFQQEGTDSNIKRNLVALIFVQHSVDPHVYEAVTSRIVSSDARRVYQALQDQFNRPSWSAVIYHANQIFHNRSDQLHNINTFANSITEAIHNLEAQLGPIDSEMLTTLAIFFAVPSLQIHITPAINTLMTTKPNLKVRPDDLLNMIRQLLTASPSFDHSTEIARVEAASRFGSQQLSAKKPPQHHFSQRPLPHANNNASSSLNKSAARTPSSKYPCHYCGEVGHWSPDCPICLKAISTRNKSRSSGANVASLGAVPLLEDTEGPIDSGATHSVVGNLSFFKSMTLTDMTLSVASYESYAVDGIGDIELVTPVGTLRLSGLLYCKKIPGVVLSLGHMINQGFDISFTCNIFSLSIHNHTLHSYRKNNQWFFPISPINSRRLVTEHAHCYSNVAEVVPPNVKDVNLLWHRRLAHLSLRNLSCMQKSNTAIGIPQTPSRQIVIQPGDLIVADLMGPYEVSLNNKKYILMIQDAFSGVVVAIPLADKSEAKTYLINWITQFLNVTTYKIKRLQTDNGTEFKNNILNTALTDRGIMHEYSVPYEHHQNGLIERTNRTISEMSRTALISAKLPSFLWPWAFRHSVWIFNRYLHANKDNTPFELLGGKKPDLQLPQVFGAKSFLHDHNFCKDFAPRSFIGYHLGVSEDSKGWLFWVPENKTVLKSASVTFDESVFYSGGIPQHQHIHSIQVQNLFDKSMIHELRDQDDVVWTANANSAVDITIPSTYREAMVSVNKVEWTKAIIEELNSMKNEEVFEVVDLKDALKHVPHESILSTKWVFNKKPDCFKARLVARGFRQIHGINYTDTFAPTPTFSSLRLLFSTACMKNWPIRTFDVKVAFLHSLINKPVYLWPPMGIAVPKFKVLKLQKALYGTKQASRCWWLHLKRILLDIGFVSNGEDASTYTLNKDGQQAVLWIHVDDGALTDSSESLMSWISQRLGQSLKIKWDDKVKGLVGISIEATKEGFKFYQPDLIQKLIDMDASNIVAKSPLPTNCNLSSDFSLGNMDKPYLKHIGILLYIAQASRPDISYAVNYLARFSLHTTTSHWEALNHLIAYLRGTRDMGIIIRSINTSNEMSCFIDANWGGECNRSTH
ncbi:hypothetical protein O181_074913 [Austropuccinia psidii MF-1]|uniref:Integrase catalytic domain-containing protein n=1 Tax=Austropuccinia psidii MF-1 TaxID=1389203 RepID=A0A9Q3FBY9_9BASI|nr:hypothetical protein [Austropuccinia psidii MF-1]